MYNFMFITLTDTYFNELTICGFSCFSLDSLVWMYVTICIRMRVSSLFCRTNTLCRRKKGRDFIHISVNAYIPCSLIMKLRNIYNKGNWTKGNCTRCTIIFRKKIVYHEFNTEVRQDVNHGVKTHEWRCFMSYFLVHFRRIIQLAHSCKNSWRRIVPFSLLNRSTEDLSGRGGGGGVSHVTRLNFKTSRVGVFTCFTSLPEIERNFFVFVGILKRGDSDGL